MKWIQGCLSACAVVASLGVAHAQTQNAFDLSLTLTTPGLYSGLGGDMLIVVPESFCGPGAGSAAMRPLGLMFQDGSMCTIQGIYLKNNPNQTSWSGTPQIIRPGIAQLTSDTLVGVPGCRSSAGMAQMTWSHAQGTLKFPDHACTVSGIYTAVPR